MLLIFNDSFIPLAIGWASAEVGGGFGAVFQWKFSRQVKIAH